MSALFNLDPQAVRVVRADSKQQILTDLAACFASVYALDADTVIDGIEERKGWGAPVLAGVWQFPTHASMGWNARLQRSFA